MNDAIRLRTGRAVLLVVASPLLRQAVARVVDDAPPRLVVEVADLESPPPGETVTLTIGPRTNRYVSRARLVEVQGTTWSLERTTSWLPFEARRSVRFPIRGVAAVEYDGRTVPAKPLDISEGGCALAVEADAVPPLGSALDVTLHCAGYSSRVPCVLVGRSPGPSDSTRLHLRFDDLSPLQRAFVRAVVASAAIERWGVV